MNNDFNQYMENNSTKEKSWNKRSLIILIITIIVLLGVIFATYFRYFHGKSINTYSKVFNEIGEVFKQNIVDELSSSSKPYSSDGTINVTSNMDQFNSYNNISISYNIGVDLKSNLISSKISYKEDNNELLNGTFLFENNKLYIKSDKIYNKTLYLGDSSEIVGSENFLDFDSDDVTYLFNKYYSSFEKSLTKAKYLDEVKKVKINGKKKLLKNNIMIIDKSNYNDIKNLFFKEIKNDKKSIKILAEILNEDEKSILDEIKEYEKSDSVKNIKPIKFEIYNTLIISKPVLIKMYVDNELLFNAESKGKNSYNLTVYNNNKKVLEGILTVDVRSNSNKISFETKYYDYTFNISFEKKSKNDLTNSNVILTVKDKSNKYYKINILNNRKSIKQIEKMSTIGAVDYYKLSNEEQYNIGENFTNALSKSKLFGPMFDSSTTSSSLDY